MYISVNQLQDGGGSGDPLPEVAGLPDTVPGILEDFQDAQTPPEEPVAELDSPKEPWQNDEVADTLPDAPEPADVQEKPTEKSLPAEQDVPGDDVSMASTLSPGEPWEKDMYRYVLQKDGIYVKYIKDEFLPLAKARSWDIGPIPVGSATKLPEASGPVQSRKDLAAQQITIKLTPPNEAVQTPPVAAVEDSPAAPPAAAPNTSPPAAAPGAGPAPPVTAPEAGPPAPPAPAPPVTAPEASPPPVAASKAQDRTLELAGLQALMEQQKLREQAAVGDEISKVQAQLVLASQNASQPKPAGKSCEISWSTHKKEGMRLKRLMEDSADGPKNFPHMAKMWCGTKEDRGIKGCALNSNQYVFQKYV